jgi:hypothetical protein
VTVNVYPAVVAIMAGIGTSIVAVARTDDDSWEITESVGATALGVAASRATEPVVSQFFRNDDALGLAVPKLTVLLRRP